MYDYLETDSDSDVIVDTLNKARILLLHLFGGLGQNSLFRTDRARQITDVRPGRLLVNMPYDEKLVKRIRNLFPSEIEHTEKKMFGGLAFFVNGNMSITVSGKGGVLIRVDPEQYETLSTEPKIEVAVMRGRKMSGWLRVPDESLRTQKQLKRWFDYCLSFVMSLPAKV